MLTSWLQIVHLKPFTVALSVEYNLHEHFEEAQLTIAQTVPLYLLKLAIVILNTGQDVQETSHLVEKVLAF